MRRAAPLSAAVAAALAFAAAFGVGMATKSSSDPQTATSLAPPVAIQAPRASLPALQKSAPTPALKPRPAPPHRTQTTQTTAATIPVAPTTPTVSSPPPVVHTPTTGVVHNPGGGTTSNNGGSGVVHGGQ